jgi:hypothetical protein
VAALARERGEEQQDGQDESSASGWRAAGDATSRPSGASNVSTAYPGATDITWSN